jgi:hypothetical protein
MPKYYVAAVRDWDEERMEAAFEHATEIGSGASFITTNYRTVKGLCRYRIQRMENYYSYVWAVFKMVDGQEDRFVGLEYNQYDEQLCAIASRYMRVRKRLQRNINNYGGYPLSVF